MSGTLTVGPYRVEERLGRGGMGEVFRAFDPRLNRPVAIKLLGDSAGAAGPAVARFLREARAASALNHPNIVTIHEIGETPAGEPFIVQEFVDGETVRSLIAREMPLASAIDIGRQVARALAAAHAAGIVHRDIKPENIMVRADGYAKVLDFGLARIIESVDSSGATTRGDTLPGTVLGTIAYMSPEQAHAGAAGPASDIFGLGVVLYEMAVGRRPFSAPSDAGVLAAIVSDQPPALRTINPAIPHAYDVLVQRMLAKEPNRRPSARQVDEALGAIGGPDVPSMIAAATTARTVVGRDAERAVLRRGYARVKHGRGLLLAASGEAGIGKTTLIETFLGDLASAGERATVARGRCSARLAGAEAYLPILEALDHLVRTSGTVESAMKTVAPTWYLQVASSDSSSSAEVRDRAGAASQERMKRELAALLQEISQAYPVVIYLEDLHWADVSTIDIINYLAGRFDEMRVLVLTTYRTAEMALAQHPFLAIQQDLRVHGAFEELPLRFLDSADVERYLAIEFPGHDLPSDLASTIHAKTEGNPLFMTDLVRYMRDSGAVTRDSGTWRLARPLADAPFDLPESVRAMIARKLDALDDVDRRLLMAASVQGHEFDSVIVAEASDMDVADVEDRLASLERVHAVVRRGDEHEFPDLALTQRYEFVHVLYQNFVYAALQPARRTSTSARVARALASHHPRQEPAIAAQLAVLFEAARDFAASARCFLAAAQHAVGLFAFREARSLCDRGLQVLRTQPEGPERTQQELGLQMIKGLALRSTVGWAAPELEEVFARARQLCQDLNDPPQLFPVLWALTLFYLIRGDLRECRARADELMEKAEREGAPALLVGGLHLAGVCREFIGDMVESSRLLERCRTTHDVTRSPTYAAMYGLDPGLIGRAMSSRPLWALGYPDRALERARETLALARTHRQPIPITFALVVLQGIHLYRGEASEALAVGDEILALCHDYGLPQEAEWCRSFQGAALAALGRTREGIDRLQTSLAVQASISAWLVRPAFLALLADALRQDGRIDEGLDAVAEGLAYAERAIEGGYVAELHRVRGELLKAASNPAEAEASFRAAIDYAARQQTKSLELRAATGLARLLLEQDRPGDARAVLAPVLGWFTEGEGTTDVVAARTTLSHME